ncbi:MAG: 30S ribosomal protein S13 [Patescibacteria group bacterium]|nr:30S ribosomal protein S13 [Patescibacteria group bacterium]
MMRIIGVNIPDNKKIKISLTSIYGVGQFSAANILQAAGVNPDKLAKELDQAEVAKLQAEIDKNFRVEGVLRQTIKQNIERLKDIKSYRGLRHIKKLPVHGQRTKTNSRTVRGNVRKTAGSGRRKVELK